MKKLKLPKSKLRELVLGGLFVVLGLWAYMAMLVIPGFREAFSLGKEVRVARDQVGALAHILSNEERIRGQYEEMVETVESMRLLLPAEEELPVIIERLSDDATRSQVKIQTIFPQISFTEEDLAVFLADGELAPPAFRTIPIQIDAVAGYHEIGTFLSLIESWPVPMEIHSLRILEHPKEFRRHSLKLVLNVFFASNRQSGTGASAAPAGGS